MQQAGNIGQKRGVQLRAETDGPMGGRAAEAGRQGRRRTGGRPDPAITLQRLIEIRQQSVHSEKDSVDHNKETESLVRGYYEACAIDNELCRIIQTGKMTKQLLTMYTDRKAKGGPRIDEVLAMIRWRALAPLTCYLAVGVQKIKSDAEALVKLGEGSDLFKDITEGELRVLMAAGATMHPEQSWKVTQIRDILNRMGQTSTVELTDGDVLLGNVLTWDNRRMLKATGENAYDIYKLIAEIPQEYVLSVAVTMFVALSSLAPKTKDTMLCVSHALVVLNKLAELELLEFNVLPIMRHFLTSELLNSEHKEIRCNAWSLLALLFKQRIVDKLTADWVIDIVGERSAFDFENLPNRGNVWSILHDIVREGPISREGRIKLIGFLANEQGLMAEDRQDEMGGKLTQVKLGVLAELALHGGDTELYMGIIQQMSVEFLESTTDGAKLHVLNIFSRIFTLEIAANPGPLRTEVIKELFGDLIKAWSGDSNHHLVKHYSKQLTIFLGL